MAPAAGEPSAAAGGGEGDTEAHAVIDVSSSETDSDPDPGFGGAGKRPRRVVATAGSGREAEKRARILAAAVPPGFLDPLPRPSAPPPPPPPPRGRRRVTRQFWNAGYYDGKPDLLGGDPSLRSGTEQILEASTITLILPSPMLLCFQWIETESIVAACINRLLASSMFMQKYCIKLHLTHCQSQPQYSAVLLLESRELDYGGGKSWKKTCMDGLAFQGYILLSAQSSNLGLYSLVLFTTYLDALFLLHVLLCGSQLCFKTVCCYNQCCG